MDSVAGNPLDGVTAGADPFARLTGTTSARKPKLETWEPRLPAGSEPPALADIKHSKFGTAVKRWDYRDGSGAALFCVVRFEPKKQDGTPASKEILPYMFGRREWTTPAGRRKDVLGWHYKRPDGPVPLYGLDRLAAHPAADVLLCEGEKSADAAEQTFPGVVAIASQGGGKAAEKADWSACAGRNVIIWPDADAPGRAFARQSAELLQEAGAALVRVVRIDLAEWPNKWDLADPLPHGVDPGRLRALLDAATDAPVAGDSTAEAMTEPPDGGTPEHTAAEVERLSHLSRVDYASERKRAAQTLEMGVGDLDKAVKAKQAEQQRAVETASRGRDAPGSGETQWPLGFISRDDGLYADQGGDAGLTWLCAPLEVLGEGREASGEGWCLYLKWRDRDGRAHTWPMPKRIVMGQPGELEGALVERGLDLSLMPDARGLMRMALNGVKHGSRVTLITQPGWHAPGAGESAYCLLNGETIGKAAEALVLKVQSENAQQKMGCAGTLDGWQREVAAKAEGNPVAAFAICAAFAGPLLDPMGESSGGFHFFGRSKTGKTLAMRLGLSVWGAPKKSGLLRDWRSTANALEGAAEECNDGLLPLDEIHQADPKEVIAAIYQLANEGGKGRMQRDTTARQRKTWRTIVLSTGEVDVAAMASKAGQRLPAGAEVRLPSIHLDGRDMWPVPHGEASPVALMAKLQTALARQHGTPIRAFLEHLTIARNDLDGKLDTTVAALRDRFCDLLPQEHDPQVGDVARRCALVAAAGEIATAWDVLPWQPGQATKCAETVLDWWLHRRGGAGSIEESQHVRAVRAFLSEFGSSRFVALESMLDSVTGKRHWTMRNPDRPVLSRAGWRRMHKDGDEYLITKDAWHDLCSKAGIDPVETAKTLADASFLTTPGDRKNLAMSIKVPGEIRTRFYVVNPTIFADAETLSDTKQAAE